MKSITDGTPTKSTSSTGFHEGRMRTFRISENSQGLTTWNIAEATGNRSRSLGDVNTWVADGLDVTANKLGIITIEASDVELVNGAARFIE